MVASVSESSLCPCAWHRPLQELLLGVEEDVLVAGDDLHPLPQLPPQWLTVGRDHRHLVIRYFKYSFIVGEYLVVVLKT